MALQVTLVKCNSTTANISALEMHEAVVASHVHKLATFQQIQRRPVIKQESKTMCGGLGVGGCNGNEICFGEATEQNAAMSLLL